MTSTMEASQVAAPAPLPGELLGRWQRLKLIVVLGALVAIGPLTIDMYLPAFPSLTDDLAATSASVQYTLTGTLLGLGLGQLLIGPLADAYGRRRPLLIGLGLYVAASAACALAPDVATLAGLRVLQGLGVAATAVAAMAVLRDMFSGAAFARLLSRLLLVMGAAPVLAPTLGGQLLRWTDWRGIFVALGLFGAALVAVAFLGLSETLPPARRRRAGVAATVAAFRGVLRDRTFLGLIVVAGLSMAALFAYVAGAPFVLQEQYDLSEQQFGLVFGAGALALITATQLNALLLRRYTSRQLLLVALVAASTAGAALLLLSVTGAGGLVGVLVPLWLVLAAAGVALPNAPALAMTRHGEAAGTAAAVLGAVQFGVGGLAAPAVGALGADGPAMAGVIAGAMAAATLLLLAMIRYADPEPAAAG